MSVSLELGYANDPTTSSPVLESDGAIRVRVDGDLLTAFDAPDVEAMTMWDPLYDRHGDELDREGFVGAWFEFELGGSRCSASTPATSTASGSCP